MADKIKEMTGELYEAFRKISGLCIAELGDAPKKDLILLGTQFSTEEELKSKFPGLYKSEDEEVSNEGMEASDFYLEEEEVNSFETELATDNSEDLEP